MSMNVTHAADAAVKAALKPSGGFSPQETAMLNTLSGADRARMEAQLALQKQQETVAFISKMLKNDTAMQAINNLK
jgi:hypothetical protein